VLSGVVETVSPLPLAFASLALPPIGGRDFSRGKATASRPKT
jgi:hypothetical protein